MRINSLFHGIRFIGMAFFLYFLSGCSSPPAIIDIELVSNPNEAAPLAGILVMKTDRPVVPAIWLDDGIQVSEVTPDPEAATEHTVPILGLRPGTLHKVVVKAKDQRGNVAISDTLSIETSPLPEDFPPVQVSHEVSGDVEPGITMINAFRWKGQFDDDPDWGLAFGVDHEGEVRWFLKTDFGISEPRRMYNGNLLISGHQDGRLFEYDMLGNLLHSWYTSGAVTDSVPEGTIPVETDAFHHDVVEMKSGNFLGLGLEVHSYEDFPLEYPPGTKRGFANVAGDVLIEFDRDGKTARSYSVVDILDPERLGQGSLQQGFYETLYGDSFDPLPYDITHSNALYYDEESDHIIVSANVQCAIYKVDMATGELKWILGDPIQWRSPWSEKLLEPQGDLIWPCHQHGIELTPDGTLLVFDNGGSRHIPPQEPQPTEDRFSRAVEYSIDEEAGTVSEVWSYGPEQEEFVSPFISDADLLPITGNVLITDGGRFMTEDGKPMKNWGGHQWGRVLEVTRGERTEKIWEVTIYDPDVRYSLYRAQRLLSLYPKLDRPTG
jgi:arylsulfate sulfotransferase